LPQQRLLSVQAVSGAPHARVRFMLDGQRVEPAVIAATPRLAPTRAHQEADDKQQDGIDAEYLPPGAAAASAGLGDTVTATGRPQRERRAAQLAPGMVRWEDIGAVGLSAVAHCMAAAAINAQGQADVPLTVAEALSGPHAAEWAAAMKKELDSMRAHHVWDWVPAPTDGSGGQRPIGCKWVFALKYDKDGKVTRFKARLVAQGFAQREGVDYGETYAPVLHYKSLRVILAIVAHQGYELLQMDVPTAFLNAPVKETVLMKPPPGLHELGLDGEFGAQPGMICKWVKNIVWHKTGTA